MRFADSFRISQNTTVGFATIRSPLATLCPFKRVKTLPDPPGLEKYYSGNSAWLRYARAFQSEWSSCPFADQLLSELNDDRKLATVIWYHLGNQSLDWLDSTPPVLDGLSPRECLATNWGLKRLRTALMRFP